MQYAPAADIHIICLWPVDKNDLDIDFIFPTSSFRNLSRIWIVKDDFIIKYLVQIWNVK